MKKRILSMLLAIVIVVGMLPGFTFTASAADVIAWTDSDGDGVQDSGEQTWDCLSDALEAGGTVRLLGDYHLPYDYGYDEKYYYIKMTQGTAVLDLNGYTLKLSSAPTYAKERSFDLSGAAELTVTDSKGSGVLAFTAGYNMAVYLSDSAKLTFAGGTVDTMQVSPLKFGVPINKSGSAEFVITGGSYNSNPTEHIPQNYVVVTTDDVSYPFAVRPMQDSEILLWNDADGDGLLDDGEQCFISLPDAGNAGVDLKLYRDVTYKNTGNNSFLITKSCTLDLNGHKLTATDDTALQINGSGINVTVKDSKGGGEIIADADYGAIFVDAGNVTVENGVYHGGLVEFSGSGGKITVLDGTIHNGLNGNVIVYGGEYSFDPSDYVADGYIAYEKEDGIWGILPDGAVHCSAELEQTEYIYNAAAHTPAVTVTVTQSGNTLTKDVDYTVAYTNNVEVGTATVTITFIKDFNGTVTREFNIRELELSASPDSIYPPIGEETSVLTLSASVNGTDVTANTNWTLEDTYAGISISDNVITVTSDAVSDTVVKVKASYLDGVATYSFTLEDTPLPNFTLSADSTTYNGTEQKPTVAVVGLTEGTDYTVTFKRGGTETNDFTNAGKIIVEVTGIGDYSGTKTQTYTIKQKSLNDAVATLTPQYTTYNGTEQKPVYTLMLDGAALVEGRDYYIRTDPAEPDYTNAGTTVFYFYGQGNYTESADAKAYVIYKKTIAESDVTVSASTVWNGSEQKPTVTVSGVSESDYTVTYTRDGEPTTDFTSCGTITVTVADARGNCRGSVTKDYVIDHDADWNCGHALLMYQAPNSEQVEYTNDVSYLEKEGTITLLEDVTVDTILHCSNTTIVMNGHSITFTSTSDRFLASYYGSLTIDASAGGRIGRDKPAEWYVSLVYLYKPLKIIGNLEFDPNFGIRVDVPTEPLDLSQYTGDGLIIRNYSTSKTFTPTLPSGYGIVPWTSADGASEEVYAGNTIPKYKYGMVKNFHTHNWNYGLDGMNTNTIKVTCTAANCPETGAKTIVISASDKVYDGTAVTATVTNNFDGTDYSTSIVYEAKTGSLTDGKAVNVGTYTAKITVGGVTASIDFTIEKKSIVAAVVGDFDPLIYSGQPQTPSAVVTVDGLTVDGSWSTVTTVGEKSTFTPNENFTGHLIADPDMASKPITITGAAIEDVLYQADGTYALKVTGVTFDGLVDGEQLSIGTDYTVAAALDGENKVGEVPALGTVTLINKNYTLGTADTFKAPVNIVVHAHEWSYRVNNDTITATCSGTIGTCPDATVTIKLNAPENRTYSGTAKTVTVTQTPAGVFTDIPAVTYVSNCTDAGEHTASLTYGGVTATLNFTIEKATINDVSVSVTEPEALATVQKTAASPDGCSASISWNLDGDTYGFNTAYTATVILTADGNHKFDGGLTADGWTVSVTADGAAATLAKTFAATRKAKLTELTDAPVNKTLSGYHADVNGAISELPAAVTYVAESGSVTVDIQWTCENYDPASRANNTFAWSVKDGELADYDANGMSTSGSITVTNVDALPVTNSGSDATITYGGTTYDVSTMFTIDANAGTASYSIVDGGTGAGTLNGSALTITKAGTIIIKVTTAANDPYAAGEATATLTVNKAAGTGTVSIEGWTYGEEAKAPTTSDGKGAATFSYNTEDGKVPTNAGTYTVTATFAATDLYEEATASASFTIAKAEPKAEDFVFTAPGNLTYSGEKKTASVSAKNGIVGMGNIDVMYYNAATNLEKQPISAGTYYVQINVAEGENYTAKSWWGSPDWKFTIVKAEAPAIQWPTASSLVYGQKLSESVLSSNDANGTFAWKDGTIVPTVNNSGYVVVYTPKDTVNYDYTGVTLEQTISVSVTPAGQADFSIADTPVVTYGDAPLTLTAVGGSGSGAITWKITSGDQFASIDENTGVLTIKGAGTVVVEATKASDGNYNAKVDTHSITINKATVSASNFSYAAPSVADLVYSKTAKAATVTGNNAYGEITIKYYSDSSLTTVIDPINVGTYYVGITTAGGANYEPLAKTLVGSFEITPKEITVTAKAQTRQYNQDNPTLTYDADVLFYGDSFTGALATDATKTSDVGTYDIEKGTLTAGDNYTITFTGAKLTITQANGPAAPDVTGSYKVVDGMTYTYTVDAIAGAEYSMDGTNWQESNVFEHLDAGQKYTFYARIKETANVLAGDIGASAEVDLSKLPGKGTVTIADWTFGEDAKAPVTNSTTGNTVDSYLYESTDGKGYSSANAPTNAGEYKLTVTFKGTATHNGTTAYDTFTIAKATPVVDAPTGLKATYGDTLASVQLPTGWTWKDAGTTEVGNAGENSFTVIYTKDDSGNYNTVEKTVTIAVAPKVVTAAVTVAGENFIFNGSKQKPGVTVKDGENTIPESEYTVTYANNTNAGTATVTITDKDGGNYTVTGETTFAIAKKASSALSGVEREFMRTIATTGNEIDVEAMLPDDHGAVTYTITSNGYTVLENVAVDANSKLVFDTKTSAAAASDTITVKVEMQNYTDVTLTVSVILNEKTPQTITGVSAVTGLIYNGEAQKGYTGTPASEKYTGTYEITYTGRSNTYNSSAAPVGAGDYTVTFKIPDSDLYYSGNFSINFTIGKAQATVTADDKEAYIGSCMPELTYKVSGLIGNDTISVELSCDANMNRAGETPIVVTATDPNGNYEITTVNGTLTVEYFPYIPPIITPTYPPVVDGGDNGDVVVSPKNPEKGDTVTIIPDPDAGYEVDEVIVTDKNGNSVTVVDNGDGTYSFKQPSGKVNIEVTFKEIDKVCPGDKTCPMYGYTDLDMTAWYHDGVHFCIENKLMNGTSTTTFAPGATTSRAMIVTILWRLAGEPVVNYAMSFEDVAADTWYTEAIRWAASEGIVNGYSDAAFGPNDNITREQLATILYRYEQKNGGGFKGMWMFRMDYVDLADVSDWAYEAMCWMNMNSIVNGKPGKVLDPKGNATRAEAATILYRYCDVIGKDDEN